MVVPAALIQYTTLQIISTAVSSRPATANTDLFRESLTGPTQIQHGWAEWYAEEFWL